MSEAYHCLHDDKKKRPSCILCSRCLEVCPLVAATGREELSPKAKFFMASKRGAGKKADLAIAHLAELCLSCGKCEKACPHNLCGPELVSELRAENPGWQEWLWKTWMTRAAVLWPLAAHSAGFLPEALTARTLPAMEKLKALADTPATPWIAVEHLDQAGAGKPAVLFSGCTGAYARKSWTRTAAALLQGLGYDTSARPEFTCCGCTLGHAGAKDAQLAMQTANIKAWREAGRPLIATFCATCRCGLRSYADVNLGWNAMEREEWLAAVVPLTGLFGESRFRALTAAPTEVYYHKPCHGAGNDRDLAFLRQVLGPRLARVVDDSCCGFGGVLQLGAPELSNKVAAHYWQRLAPPKDAALLTSCSGCVLQLTATAPAGVAVRHWLDVLRLE
jgi:glycolate oxidase iron-sulfur subunit